MYLYRHTYTYAAKYNGKQLKVTKLPQSKMQLTFNKTTKSCYCYCYCFFAAAATPLQSLSHSSGRPAF